MLPWGTRPRSQLSTGSSCTCFLSLAKAAVPTHKAFPGKWGSEMDCPGRLQFLHLPWPPPPLGKAPAPASARVGPPCQAPERQRGQRASVPPGPWPGKRETRLWWGWAFGMCLPCVFLWCVLTCVCETILMPVCTCVWGGSVPVSVPVCVCVLVGGLCVCIHVCTAYVFVSVCVYPPV